MLTPEQMKVVLETFQVANTIGLYEGFRNHDRLAELRVEAEKVGIKEDTIEGELRSLTFWRNHE